MRRPDTSQAEPDGFNLVIAIAALTFFMIMALALFLARSSPAPHEAAAPTARAVSQIGPIAEHGP